MNLFQLVHRCDRCGLDFDMREVIRKARAEERAMAIAFVHACADVATVEAIQYSWSRLSHDAEEHFRLADNLNLIADGIRFLGDEVKP